MPWDFPGVRRLLRLRPRSARAIAREIDEEIEAHLALRIDHLTRRGVPPEEARAEALRKFGDLGEAREQLVATAREREARLRLREWLESLGQDLRFALRQVRRARAFTAFAVLTFAASIGLTTTVFAVIDGVLLRPLAMREPERLLSLGAMDSAGRRIEVVSSADARDWEGARSLEGVALYGLQQRLPVLGDEAVRVPARVVTPNFFRVLGTRLLAGRGFAEDEGGERPTAAVVSERLWRGALGADPSLARPLRVFGRVFTVIGVVPDAQVFPDGTDLWLPYREPYRTGGARNNINYSAVARLAPGATAAGAGYELHAIAARIRAADPAALYAWGVAVSPLRDEMVAGARTYLELLMGAVGLVLLIACANLASANLARGTTRAREMAVRAALGAGRRRLVRQLLVEHLLVAAAGGALGASITWALTRALAAAVAGTVPRADQVVVDARVLAFAAGVTALAGLLAGLAPALQASRVSLRASMAEGGRGAVRGGLGGRTFGGRALIAGEVALALLLVVGAGLLVKSFREVLAQELGFRTDGVVTAELMLTGPRYTGDRAAGAGRALAGWSELLTALRETPGIETAGVANWVPLGMGGSSFVEIEGRDEPRAGASYRVVTDGYFGALGMPLLAGRDIAASDDSAKARVAVINRRMAERYWPTSDPIGRRVRATSMEGFSGTPAQWLTVVGVVGDVRHWGPEQEPAPEMYVSLRQVPRWARSDLTLVARGSSATVATSRLAQLVRERIRAFDPALAADVEPLAARYGRATAERRFTMEVLGAFGLVALALAALGVYGVLSFAVAARAREMAVRAALGASRGQLLALVVGSGVRLVAAGAAAGLAGAWALTRLMRSLLFAVAPTDPAVFATAAATVLVAGALSTLIPALRATHVDPMRALGAE